MNPFVRGGCGVERGILSEGRPHFNLALAFPSPPPPDFAEVQEAATTTTEYSTSYFVQYLYSCPQRELLL
jgi:hypothetical protein